MMVNKSFSLLHTTHTPTGTSIHLWDRNSADADMLLNRYLICSLFISDRYSECLLHNQGGRVQPRMNIHNAEDKNIGADFHRSTKGDDISLSFLCPSLSLYLYLLCLLYRSTKGDDISFSLLSPLSLSSLL
jgi:hypothetical protein